MGRRPILAAPACGAGARAVRINEPRTGGRLEISARAVTRFESETASSRHPPPYPWQDVAHEDPKDGCRSVNDKIAETRMSSWNINLRKFDSRTKNDGYDAQGPFASAKDHPKGNSGHKKNCGVLDRVRKKRNGPRHRWNHRERDNGQQQEPSHHPIQILEQNLTSVSMSSVAARHSERVEIRLARPSPPQFAITRSSRARLHARP
jgi:hypothetical protein